MRCFHTRVPGRSTCLGGGDRSHHGRVTVLARPKLRPRSATRSRLVNDAEPWTTTSIVPTKGFAIDLGQAGTGKRGNLYALAKAGTFDLDMCFCTSTVTRKSRGSRNETRNE